MSSKRIQDQSSVNAISSVLAHVMEDKTINAKAVALAEHAKALFVEGHKATLLGTGAVMFSLFEAHKEGLFKRNGGGYLVDFTKYYSLPAGTAEEKKIRDRQTNLILIMLFGFPHHKEEDGTEDKERVSKDAYVPAGLLRAIKKASAPVAYLLKEDGRDDKLKEKLGKGEDLAPIVSLVTEKDHETLKATIKPDKSNLKSVMTRIDQTPLGGLKIRVSAIARRRTREKDGKLSTENTKAVNLAVAYFDSIGPNAMHTRTLVIGSTKVRQLDQFFATFDELEEVARQQLNITRGARTARQGANQTNTALAGADSGALVEALASKVGNMSTLPDSLANKLEANLEKLAESAFIPFAKAFENFLANWDIKQGIDADSKAALAHIRNSIDDLLETVEEGDKAVTAKAKQLATAGTKGRGQQRASA